MGDLGEFRISRSSVLGLGSLVFNKTKDRVLRPDVVYFRAMRVLGIDPGSQTTGWGVVEGDGRRYSLVAFGSIRAPSTLKFSTRLLKMCNGLRK